MPRLVTLFCGGQILVYAAVPPGATTENFRAVGYFSMSPASWSPSYPNVWKDKVDSYCWFKTSDHRTYVESWRDHKRQASNQNTSVDKDDWILARQRPYYRYCPPKVTLRLAELYGLLPYETSGEEYDKKAVERAIIRGVRFTNEFNDDFRAMMPSAPLCTATTKTFALSDSGLVVWWFGGIGSMHLWDPPECQWCFEN